MLIIAAISFISSLAGHIWIEVWLIKFIILNQTNHMYNWCFFLSHSSTRCITNWYGITSSNEINLDCLFLVSNQQVKWIAIAKNMNNTWIGPIIAVILLPACSTRFYSKLNNTKRYTYVWQVNSRARTGSHLLAGNIK